jgi:diguanylate cyclase (GGDEF)-like protein
MFVSSYSNWLVFVSLLVAILASYTALDMTGRLAASQGRSARWWLMGGSLAMGIGIWSMHFIGMLAFSLPIPMGYDPSITLLSLLIAIASSAFALWLVCQKELSQLRLGLGAWLMGAGIAAMHYTGMAAMRMTPRIQYIPSLFILSIVIAVAASGTALWIAFHLRQQSSRIRLFRAGAALLMGFAITGMHYTGMAAARFPIGSVCSAVHSGVNAGWLALLIIIATLAVLAIALITSILDMRTTVLATSLADANQELVYLALHDNLTKLPNRVLLEDRLDQAIQNAKRENTRFSLMFIDLDGFKVVNDAFGHHFGDLLLVNVAECIRTNIRSRDTLARIGGDEFVLLADVDEPMDAADIADKLVTGIRRPFDMAGHELRVSASIGIAIYDGNGEDRHGLLKNADAAMYHAKALGRNGYCFFKTSMNTNAQEHLQLVHDLRAALERHELVLYYQPKFDAVSLKMIGVEALLRWKHPTRGLISPDQFIALAEKTGLIVPIGEWVLNEACRQMAQWRNAGNTNWTVAVNLSSLQFGDAELIRVVRETLERHALEPRCLTLEVTESTAMNNADATVVILQQLRDLGVHISIDDFGTGYSSLLYLKRLSASELKIDRGFVRDLTHDTEDAAIVSAIVALGHTLNLNVVAEGVETREQQEFLTHLGCSSLQGFLLGRPMTADQVDCPIVCNS